MVAEYNSSYSQRILLSMQHRNNEDIQISNRSNEDYGNSILVNKDKVKQKTTTNIPDYVIHKFIEYNSVMPEYFYQAPDVNIWTPA